MLHRYSFEIKWGVLFILFQLGWVLAERLLGFHSTLIAWYAMANAVFLLVSLLFYTLALSIKRRDFYYGEMSWQQGFYCGLVITIVVVVLTPLSHWLIHTVISPHLVTNMATYTMQGTGLSGNVAVTVNPLLLGIQAVINAILTGVVISAAAAFLLRPRPWARKKG